MATVSELLEIARRQIGVKESPPNSNNVRYNTWYYGREVSGAVERRARKFAQIVGAVRPTYDKEVDEVRYNTVSECPSWARETVQKLVDKEYLNGTGEGLDLSADMVRLLVILDRAGAFK